MTVVQPSFTKLKLFRQYYVENSYAKFHDNPTNDLVVFIRLQIDGQILLISRSFSLGQAGQARKRNYW